MVRYKMKREEEGGAAVSPAEVPRDKPKSRAASTTPSEAGQSIASTNASGMIFTPEGSTCSTPEETTPRATFRKPSGPAPTASVHELLTGISLLDLGPNEHDAEPEQPKPMSKSAKLRLKKKLRKQQEEEQTPAVVTSTSKSQRQSLRRQLKKQELLLEDILDDLQEPELSKSKTSRLRKRLKETEKRMQNIISVLEQHEQLLSQQAQPRQPSPQAQPEQEPQPAPILSKSQKENRKEKSRKARKQAKEAARVSEYHEEEPFHESEEAWEEAKEAWGDVNKAWGDVNKAWEDVNEAWEEVHQPEEKQLPRRKEILTEAKILELFGEYFGDRKLANWQRFCIDLGLGDQKISTLTQCKKTLESIHINIYDLMDAIEERNSLPEEQRTSPLKVKTFANANQLYKHAKKNGGLFPRRAAKEGGPLRGLLKHFYGPGGALPRGGGVMV